MFSTSAFTGFRREQPVGELTIALAGTWYTLWPAVSAVMSAIAAIIVVYSICIIGQCLLISVEYGFLQTYRQSSLANC